MITWLARIIYNGLIQYFTSTNDIVPHISWLSQEAQLNLVTDLPSSESTWTQKLGVSSTNHATLSRCTLPHCLATRAMGLWVSVGLGVREEEAIRERSCPSISSHRSLYIRWDIISSEFVHQVRHHLIGVCTSGETSFYRSLYIRWDDDWLIS